MGLFLSILNIFIAEFSSWCHSISIFDGPFYLSILSWFNYAGNICNSSLTTDER